MLNIVCVTQIGITIFFFSSHRDILPEHLYKVVQAAEKVYIESSRIASEADYQNAEWDACAQRSPYG